MCQRARASRVPSRIQSVFWVWKMLTRRTAAHGGLGLVDAAIGGGHLRHHRAVAVDGIGQHRDDDVVVVDVVDPRDVLVADALDVVPAVAVVEERGALHRLEAHNLVLEPDLLEAVARQCQPGQLSPVLSSSCARAFLGSCCPKRWGVTVA